MTVDSIINPTGNPHQLFRYRVGTKTHKKGVAGALGRPAAKCRCGWEGIGEENIIEHQAVADMWNPVPPAVRSTDPDTSREAAVRTPGRNSQLVLLLRCYYVHTEGLTNEEAGDRSGLSSNVTTCYWKRCSELAKLGYTAPTGEKRPSRAGRMQRVHAITEAGEKFLEGLL